MSNKPVVLFGSGGHASVLADVLEQMQIDIGGIFTLSSPERAIFANKDIYFEDECLRFFPANDYEVVVGVGPLPDQSLRLKVIEQALIKGYKFKQVISNSAIISQYASLSEGVQILFGAVINSGAKISRHAVINTKAIIEHDCIIGSFTHVAPGAIICGGVEVADKVFVGAGAVILPGVKIGRKVIIGANALVDQDVPPNTTVYGCRGKMK